MQKKIKLISISIEEKLSRKAVKAFQEQIRKKKSSKYTSFLQEAHIARQFLNTRNNLATKRVNT